MTYSEPQIKAMCVNEIEEKVKLHFGVDLNDDLAIKNLADQHGISCYIFKGLWRASKMYLLNENIEEDDFCSNSKSKAIASMLLIYCINPQQQ